MIFQAICRASLLASAACLMTSLAPSGATAAPRAAQDLGAVPAGMTVNATIWLRPHDEAAFEAAIAARSTRGSPLYHHWMTPAEAASYGATDADVDALEGALRRQGLTIVKREADNSAIRVTGSAAVVQAAFRTPLHVFARDGVQYYRNTAAPAFAGDHAALIGGITGLTNAHLTPYVIQRRDPATGAPLTFATGASLAASFTDHCFARSGTVSIHAPGVQASYAGPIYTANGGHDAKTCGYTAAQVATHYGLPAVYSQGYRGDGETIVLVDAFGSPTILSDANVFAQKMGLPPLTSANFSIVYPDGQPTQNPYPTGWPVEISLDVEWAHAIAPNAHIVLVVAPDDDETEMAYALHYAVANQLGDVISNSYGYPEFEFGPAGASAFNTAIRQGAAQGIAINVSTGDSGDNGLGTPVGAPASPSDSPYATGVGGTSLNLPSDIGPVEAVWGITATYLGKQKAVEMPPDFLGFGQGGGGGESVYFAKPAYQRALPGTGRQLPDVSAVADPQTGAIIVTPNATGRKSVIEVIGGTSLASPVFSGIWALATQAAGARLGQAAPIVAQLPAGAVTDIVPIQASHFNLNGSIVAGTATQVYSPPALLNLVATQPNGFVGIGAVFGGEHFDLGFGADSSLATTPGWDDATGYGAPAPGFVAAAAAAGAVAK
jgi:subtilase family serine protease